LMLETVDLSLTLDRESYVREVTRRQIQLRDLGYQVYLQKRPVVIAFEGWDAAGKGGAIKRITEKLDPRGYVVYPISAPQGEDKTRHYLYRFWRRLPERGQIAIFDRSWYGRVLVERVEGFATTAEWKRGFKEMFGVTVYGYLTEQRLETARRALLDTDKTAAEVAFELGYATPQHFHNAFKKRFGVTPNSVRKAP